MLDYWKYFCVKCYKVTHEGRLASRSQIIIFKLFTKQTNCLIARNSQ